MGIRAKLFLSVLALAVPALIFVGVTSYLGGKAAVEQTTSERLTAVRAGKAHAIEEHFDDIRSLARIFARDRMIVDAMVDFDTAHQEMLDVELKSEQREQVAAYYNETFLPHLESSTGAPSGSNDFMPMDDVDIYLQYHYIAANDHPQGARDLLDDAGDGSEYSFAHSLFHPLLRDFVHEFGFHDLFLISGAGHIVYTVGKEVDLGTSLIVGPYRDSNLAAAFQMAQQDSLGDAVQLVDFAPFAPSMGEPAAFLAVPIIDGAWVLGVLVLQIDIGEIDDVMTSNRNWKIDGLGDTGESFLVGPDFTMRSNSRFFLEDPAGFLAAARKEGTSAAELHKIQNLGTTILIQEVKTEAAAAALADETATITTNDYRGVEVLTSYAPLAIEGVDWAIMSEIDTAEAYARIRTFTRNLVLRLAGLLSLFLVAAWFLTRRFVAPIVGLDGAARRFAAGEEDVEVPVTQNDELGGLEQSFNQMVSAIRQKTSDLQKTAEELEGVSSVILRWDSEGRIRFINDYGLNLFGFSADELVGQPLAGSIVPPSDVIDDNIRQMIDEIAVDPSKYEIDETENRRKNGELIWMAWRNTPILNNDGRLQEILTIGIDITERRRIEREIAEQKQLLENTLESLTHPFYVIDTADYSIKLANSAALKSGASGATTCHALTHHRPTPCDSAKHACPMVKVKRTKRPFTVEHIHNDRDGNPRYVEVHGYPIFDDDGDVIQMIEYSHDITERKMMELQLEDAKDAAEAANRAKSTFLANMSHELRTPMNAIIGYSEMLAEDAEDEGHDDMVPDLEKINTAGKHLLELINDILDLSKIEAGRMELFLDTFDLREMLNEAVATVTPLISKNGNALATEFADDLGAVRLDLTKLRQALFNLLSNAAKFTENGTITIIAAKTQREAGDRLVLSVTDTGIGISEDKLEAVFEEFSQADDSTTRDYGGTGLGLPISRRFCQMMGGDITVTSEVGKGTTFTIDVPTGVGAVDAAKASVQPDEPSAREASPRTRLILVVDDDPNSRELLQRTLEADGFSVATASTGEEGLELARELKPSLITLDVLMPSMDGWSVLQEIKTDPGLENIPVMMISIAGDDDLGFTLGAVESLTKPVDRDRLRQVARLYASPAGGGHALVVDDDDGIRSLFRRALSEDGWTVAEAENGAVGLERVGEENPDLVLLDLMMPVMDGFEFAIHFRKLDGCDATPIIVVTAKDLDQQEKDILLGSVQRIVEKGALTRQQILEQVREIMSQSNITDRDAAREDDGAR